MLSRMRRCQQSPALRRLHHYPFCRSIIPTSTPERCRSLRYRSDAAGNTGLGPASTEPRPWRRPAGRSSPGNLEGRGLATALDDYKPMLNTSAGSFPDPSFPMPYSPAVSTPLHQPPPAPFHLRPQQPVLVVRDDTPELPSRQKTNLRGVPGDEAEILSIFDACMQVGKLDRAGVVLQRLSSNKFHRVDGDHLMALHNRYLRVSLEQLIAEPSATKAEAMHKWYELYVRKGELPETPETIAIMLKAALVDSAPSSSPSKPSASASREQRLVMRYMGMLEGDMGLQVLYLTDILSDHDRARITELCPAYNLPTAVDTLDLPSQPADEADYTSVDGVLESSSHEEAEAAAEAWSSPTLLSDLPDVLATPQKGGGLPMLDKALGLLGMLPEGHDIAELPEAKRREVQMRLEKDCIDAALERWREDHKALMKLGLNTSLNASSMNPALHQWHQALEEYYKQEITLTDVSEAADPKSPEDVLRCVYGPFFRQSTPSRLAAITILSALSCISMHGVDKSVSCTVMVKFMSKILQDDIESNKRRDEMKKKLSKRKGSRTDIAASPSNKAFLQPMAAEPGSSPPSSSTGSIPRTSPIGVEAVSITSDSSESEVWPLNIRAQVGGAMTKGLLDSAKITRVKENPETKETVSQVQPAFLHGQEIKKGGKIGVVKINKGLLDLLKREPNGDFLARHLPMVCEPEPWTEFAKGGFITSPTPIVRVKELEKSQINYTKVAIQRGDMDQIFKGLDALGRTAWKINKPVLRVLLEVWNQGESFAEVPPLNPEIELPSEPESMNDPLQRRNYLRKLREAENQRTSLHSQRCYMNLQLVIARAFSDQSFYLPHNVDFRGRAYPMPTYFNHMGADHVRGLMMFAKGMPLGEDGLRWLKVHLANVFGFDKASLKEREAFAMQHMDDVIDSATNPLSGSRWWYKAEDPWQCLATCYELKAAMKSPDPTQFVSHMPVHQDGTCNGLQHYAALGGDTWGAQQVNLMPGDRPADIYSAVAELVQKAVDEEAKLGHPLGVALTGKVTRKVVKQTVMTNVYGVTFSGAKKQIQRQLDDLYPNLAAETDGGTDSLFHASYLATKVFKALSDMFSGAHDIQTWFGEIGSRACKSLTADQIDRIERDEAALAQAKVLLDTRRVARAERKTPRGRKRKGEEEEVVRTKKAADKDLNAAKAMVRAATKGSTFKDLAKQLRNAIVWTTPLRMPVVQPYRKSSQRTISTPLQNLILTDPGRADPVNTRKQLQAFPPNFIHSLDASHMMLSALECDAMGITFAAVHDSFWTHAGDVGRMNRVLRDAFVRIHEEDVIGRLADEFRARYDGAMYIGSVSDNNGNGSAGKVGGSVVKKIKEWRAANKMPTSRQELLLERRRLQLLRSDDPEMVRLGREMVTPASMVAEYAAVKGVEVDDLVSQDEDAAAALAAKDASSAADGGDVDGDGNGGGLMAGVEDVLGEAAIGDRAGEDHDGLGGFEGDALAEEEGEVDAAAADGAAESETADASRSNSAEFEQSVESYEKMKGTTHLGLSLTKEVKAKAKRAPPQIQVWFPMSFPSVPPKGDFDVKQLRNSDYFFS